MKHTMKKLLALMLCIAMVAAVAVGMSGCAGKDAEGSETTTAAANEKVTMTDGETLGEGSKSFTFTVVGTDGKEITVQIKTDKEMLGEALQELHLIEGEMGEYGLYVKTVNGETLDFDQDGKYWALYVDGEYALKSADLTEITEGAVYSFKAEA